MIAALVQRGLTVQLQPAQSQSGRFCMALITVLRQHGPHIFLKIEDRFRSRLLYPMHVLAVLPQRHRLSRFAVLDVTELADEPLLRLTSGFASHGWFEAACQVAHVWPRVLLESVAPQTLIALAQAGHGIAVVPSPVRIPRAGVRVAVVMHRGVPIGRWTVAAWEPERFLPLYAEQFIEQLVVHCQRDYPGRAHVRRVPPLPKPKVA